MLLTTWLDLAFNRIEIKIRKMANHSLVPVRVISEFLVGMGLLSSVLPAVALTPIERSNQLRQYVFNGGLPIDECSMYRCGISKGADCSKTDNSPLTSEWVNLKYSNYNHLGYHTCGGEGANSSAARLTVAKGNYSDVSCEFGGRVGRVFFDNKSAYPIKVKLWHPDSISVYLSKTVGATSSMYLGDFNVGDDWGIQLGTSRIKCIGNASNFMDSTDWTLEMFYVESRTFHKYK